MSDKRIISSIDTETGGLYANKNPILQIGMAIYELDAETLQFEQLAEGEWNFKPSQFADKVVDPHSVEEVNHLNLEELEKNGLLVSEVEEQMAAMLANANPKGWWSTVIGHNFRFDKKFIQVYMKDFYRHQLDSFRFDDTIQMIDLLFDTTGIEPDKWPDRKLPTICKLLGVTNDKAHTALSDAKATFLVYVGIRKKLREVGCAMQAIRYSKASVNTVTQCAESLNFK